MVQLNPFRGGGMGQPKARHGGVPTGLLPHQIRVVHGAGRDSARPLRLERLQSRTDAALLHHAAGGEHAGGDRRHDGDAGGQRRAVAGRRRARGVRGRVGADGLPGRAELVPGGDGRGGRARRAAVRGPQDGGAVRVRLRRARLGQLSAARRHRALARGL